VEICAYGASANIRSTGGARLPTVPVPSTAAQPETLAVLPDFRATQHPSGPCLDDATVSLDNAAFLDRVVRAAGALRRQGVGAGDVVAIVLPNRVELIVSLFATWRVGATATPVNPALLRAEIAYQLEDAGAKVVIGTGEPFANAHAIDVDTLDREEPTDISPATLAPDDLALLIYTSGTTGKPKGVMLDHRNVRTMCQMGIDSLDVTADDHSLLILPLFHVNGIVAGTIAPLLVGGRVTIGGQFSPATFLDLVEHVRPTFFSAVPAIYALLTALPEADAADLSSLRLVICGAAPTPPELIKRFEARFGVVLVEGYGLSEGTCASTINPYDGLRKPGTVGLPMAGQEVAIVADGRPQRAGERGEVVIRGANVMRGYLNRPQETATTIVDGWLHTGDVGYLDEDGYLVLVDRIKDMIIRGGENVYPKEVETVLYTHPDVLEAAVVGRPDDVMGEVVAAYVVLRPDATAIADDLHALCERDLARYKRPVSIELLDVLPKNAVGKIDKPNLRSLAAAT
jgi:long-chain acyl-CoA synthetase